MNRFSLNLSKNKNKDKDKNSPGTPTSPQQPSNTPASTSGGKMGNGASVVVQVISIDGEMLDAVKIKSLIVTAQQEAKGHKTRVEELEKILVDTKADREKKKERIVELSREVDKLRSVLTLTATSDLAARVNHQEAVVPPTPSKDVPNIRSKKQGVSGESGSQSTVELRHHEKDFRSKQQIKDAIRENDFLNQLEPGQVKEIVECMYEKTIALGAYVIREGELGAHLYVSAEGDLEVSKDGKILGTMNPGRTFGELALLYNCNRTASVKALQKCKVWTLDQKVFQRIMMISNIQLQDENIRFLKSVPHFEKLGREKLSKLADCLERSYYAGGQFIVREREPGQTFFIIRSGNVKVTQLVRGKTEPQDIRSLKEGDFFGEKALMSGEDIRTANVIAKDPGVEVLVLDRKNFNVLLGDFGELKNIDYGDDERNAQKPSPIQQIPVDNPFAKIQLTNLEVIATLGMGGFGRVELVNWSFDKTKSFALKCLKKKHIVETRQQNHVLTEKDIMLNCNCQFICRLYATFKDKKYVYMLVEVCLGGELWSILRDRVHFDDAMTRFYVAGVIEALSYLHGNNIVYRDLKPENVLLDSQGYIKLCDFGFAKKIATGRKTWTFCGTPEYVAPEIVMNKGHDFAADYWALGLFMFELLTGSPAFSGTDAMRVYNVILKGLDVIEFPKSVSKNAHSIIKKLCKNNPSERLGYGKGGVADIRSNKYFQGFDWDGLRKRTLKAPIIPVIKNPTDSSNFDKYPKETEVAPDELSGWDESF